MATLPELEIAIGADITEIKRALQALGKDIQSVKTAAGKPVSLGLDVDKARAGMTGLLNQVKATVAAYAGFQSVAALGRLADQANTLAARLKLATQSQQEYNTAQAETFAIAQRAGASTAAVVDLFTKTERATRELGVSQNALLQFTETLSKAGAITGGGPGLDAAIFQLTQGLASGTLRGEELNSVLEQAPRIAQLIADSLGVPIGKLRELAEQGKLTTEAVLRAGLDARKVIDAEYAQLPETIGRSLTKLQNAFLKFVADADKATGASTAVANAITALADNLPQIVSVVVTLAKVWGTYVAVFKVIPALTAAASLAQTRLAAALTAVRLSATGAAVSVRSLVFSLRGLQAGSLALITGWELGTFLRENFAIVEKAGNVMVEGLLIAWEKLKKYARILYAFIDTSFSDLWNIITFSDREDASGAFKAQMDKIVAESDDAVAAIKENFAAVYDEIDKGGSLAERRAAEAAAEAKRLQDELKKQGLQIPETAKDSADSAKKNKFDATLRAAADQNELIVDSIDRALSELERRYDDNLVSLNSYYTERARLQATALDAELASKRQELAALVAEQEVLRTEGGDNSANIESQSRLLTEIIKLERDRAEIAPAAARDQAEAERELARQLLEVRTRLAEATGQTSEARRQAIEAEFAELRASLRGTENEQAGLELIDKLINVEAAKANLDELEENISDTLETLRAQEANIAAQIDAGLVGQFRGEQELQSLRERSIEQLSRYKAALEAAYAAAKDPQVQAEISKRITALDTELARVTATTRQLQNQLRDIGQSGLKTFFTDIMSGTKSIGEAFRGLISDIARRIGELAADNVAGAIVGQLGGGGGGFNFGDLLGKAGSFFSSFFHRGGIVGQGAPVQRMVPAWAFAGAPRYHSGGMAGLKPDEVPAVLQKGEEVLAKDDPRNAANGSQQGAFRVVNVLDPRLAGDYLESSEGERVIMNIIGRNPGQVRQLLG